MAGITDAPFRRLCRAKGAGLATSEMVTSDTRLWQSNKTRTRLTAEDSPPFSIQIAGSDATLMAEAAKQAVDSGAQIIDINMGCPAKKVCKKLAGSALLKDEKLVANILTRVTQAVQVPVTLKTRTGWDTRIRNGKQIARIAEDCGIQALAVHGRTRACRFNGEAEYDTIAEIAANVAIPVIANGDIDCPQKAKRVLEYTCAAAVMIGRPALGNPWIFEQIEHFLDKGVLLPKPAPDQVRQTLAQHITDLTVFYGELKGARIARKHARWYLQPFGDITAFLRHFNTLSTLKTQLEAVDDFFERPSTHEEYAA